MRNILILSVKGLLTVLPIALTFYLLFWLGFSIEEFVKPHLIQIFYFPGLGIICTFLLLVVIGVLVNAYIVSKIVDKLQQYIERLPVVKTLFGALKDAVELFQISKNQQQKRACLVEIAQDMHVLGFITGENATKMLFNDEEKQAVYIPMSYQIGGYTVYVNPSKVKTIDINVETAMRIAVTGGNSIRPDH